MKKLPLHMKQLGLMDYGIVLKKMREFTDHRNHSTPDEIWFCQHPAVYTQGSNGDPKHIINPGNIPIVKTDRGGQVTYHGPGQCVVYPLISLKRYGFGIKSLVNTLEQWVIDLLAQYQIQTNRRPKAPGLYAKNAKIASIGLRIRKGSCYHGVALNVAMDLSPFKGINPCGFEQLAVTQIADLGGPRDVKIITKALEPIILKSLTARIHANA